MCGNTRLPSNVEIVFKIKVLQESRRVCHTVTSSRTIQKEDTDFLIVVKYRGDQSTLFMFTVHQRLMNINQPSFSNSGQHRVRFGLHRVRTSQVRTSQTIQVVYTAFMFFVPDIKRVSRLTNVSMFKYFARKSINDVFGIRRKTGILNANVAVQSLPSRVEILLFVKLFARLAN